MHPQKSLQDAQLPMMHVINTLIWVVFVSDKLSTGNAVLSAMFNWWISRSRLSALIMHVNGCTVRFWKHCSDTGMVDCASRSQAMCGLSL